MDQEVYGRSIYENSSFIASSKNPNEDCRGKGFVARLSGSTIEFISMWKLIMFGKNAFTISEEELIFSPQPAVPDYLIPEDGKVKAILCGKTAVTYSFSGKKNYLPGEYEIKAMKFVYENGSIVNTSASFAAGQIAEDIREGRILEIEIRIA